MTTTTAPHTDWYSTEFAAIAATPYPSIYRPTFHTVGHANASCPTIKGERIPTTSLAAYVEANENWDGEVEYLAPWPCGTCVSVKGAPATVGFTAPAPTYGTGTPAPRPAVEVDPQADQDLAAAKAYASSYAGSFEFMVDMRAKALRAGSTFTPKMVAAILRCKAADEARATRPAAVQVTPATEADGNEDGRRLNLAPNAFAGQCRSCRGTVPANAGRREKVEGRWTVLHSTTTECTTATVPAAVPQAPVAPLPDVPAGHYAVETEEGHLAFYNVDRPTEGRWQGRVFLSVQASDEYHPVRGEAARTILAKIATDPRTAMLRYGTEIGRCGHCHRTLTDETSRALGIGPVCRAGMGF